MPQELQVVQCYKCSRFQVDIVKKMPKWTCKICGEKQSLRQVFAVGSGKDMRKVVQKANNTLAEKPPTQKTEDKENNNKNYLEDVNLPEAEAEELQNQPNTSTSSITSESKWMKYLDEKPPSKPAQEDVTNINELNEISFNTINNKRKRNDFENKWNKFKSKKDKINSEDDKFVKINNDAKNNNKWNKYLLNSSTKNCNTGKP